MRIVGLFVACVLGVLAGIGIGCIPVVNENLHWNIWFILPVSGAILGGALGWVQFQIARLSGARVGVVVASVLALATAVGYLGTDLGTYWTMTVEIEESDEFEGGAYRLADLMSFEAYMQARLESSSINMRPGREGTALELGSAASLVSFGVDALGAWLGAFVVLFGSALGYPFCTRCQRYKTNVGKSEVALDDERAVEQVEQLQEQVESGEYESVVSLLNSLAKEPPAGEHALKLSIDERVCTGCNEATLICKVLRLEGVNWEEALDLQLDSGAGNTARLAVGA